MDQYSEVVKHWRVIQGMTLPVCSHGMRRAHT